MTASTKDKPAENRVSEINNEVEEYKVGYGKPPKKSQFKVGQSGNRKGRPRKCENFSTIARRLGNETMTVRDGGRERKVTRQEAFLLKIWQGAFAGEAKSISALLSVTKDIGSIVFIPPDDGPRTPDLVAEDLAILQRFTTPLAKVSCDASIEEDSE